MWWNHRLLCLHLVNFFLEASLPFWTFSQTVALDLVSCTCSVVFSSLATRRCLFCRSLVLGVDVVLLFPSSIIRASARCDRRLHLNAVVLVPWRCHRFRGRVPPKIFYKSFFLSDSNITLRATGYEFSRTKREAAEPRWVAS